MDVFAISWSLLLCLSLGMEPLFREIGESGFYLGRHVPELLLVLLCVLFSAVALGLVLREREASVYEKRFVLLSVIVVLLFVAAVNLLSVFASSEPSVWSLALFAIQLTYLAWLFSNFSHIGSDETVLAHHFEAVVAGRSELLYVAYATTVLFLGLVLYSAHVTALEWYTVVGIQVTLSIPAARAVNLYAAESNTNQTKRLSRARFVLYLGTALAVAYLLPVAF